MNSVIRPICLTVAFLGALAAGCVCYQIWVNYDVVHLQQLMEYEKQKQAPLWFQAPPQGQHEKHYYEFELPGAPKQTGVQL